MNDKEKYFTKSGVEVAFGIGAIAASHLINKNVVNGGPDAAGILEWFGSLSLGWGALKAAMGGIALGTNKLLSRYGDENTRLKELPQFSVHREELAKINLSECSPQSIEILVSLLPSSKTYDVHKAGARAASKLEEALFSGLQGGIETIEDKERIANVVDGAYLLDRIVPIELDDVHTPTTVEGEKHWFDYINARVQSRLYAEAA